MLRAVLLLFFIVGIFHLETAQALPNPPFTFDMARFKEAGTDLAKLKVLRTELCQQYLDKYFEIYSKENNIDIGYSQLSYLKNRVKLRFDQEKFAQSFIPISVAQAVASFKKIADVATEEFESSGRLLIAQRQTSSDALLKKLSERLESSSKLKQAMVEKVEQLELEVNASMKTAVQNQSLENRTNALSALFKKFEYIVYSLIGFSALNVMLTVFFYRRTL